MFNSTTQLNPKIYHKKEHLIEDKDVFSQTWP